PRSNEVQAKSVVRGGVVGEFAGAQGPDLLVLVAEQQAPIRGYRVAGTATGLDTAPTPSTTVDGLADCRDTGASAACVQSARYLAWPRTSGGDVVIAVDGRSPPRAQRIDPGRPAQALAMLVDGLPQGATIQALHAVDIDGDG